MTSRLPKSGSPCIFFGLGVVVFMIIAFKKNGLSNEFLAKSDLSDTRKADSLVEPNVKIALVSCGSARTFGTVTLVKSAVIFTSRTIDFYIITEKKNIPKFIEQFDRWPEEVRNKFTYQFTEPYFPSNDSINWKPIFRTCATQRLFLPEMFNSTDSMLYLDADILLFDDVAELWNELKHFNDKEIVAFAPDFYSRDKYPFRPPAKIPYYGKFGINSGVMLMNLTRLREFKLYEKLIPIYQRYKKDIPYGDQCLLNILFHKDSDRVHDLDCSWNFFFVYCEKIFTCPSANDRGLQILHGIAGSFHNGKWPDPKFKLIYQAFLHYDFKKPADNIYSEIQSAFVKHNSSLCSHRSNAFLKNLAQLESS